MIRSLSLILLLTLIAMLSACGGGASTTVQPTHHRLFTTSKMGKICGKSLPKGAPFTVFGRDGNLKFSGIADDPVLGCTALPLDWYSVIPGNVATYLGTPPATRLLEFEPGLRFDVELVYLESANADPEATILPTLESSEKLILPEGEICVKSDIGGAPFIILNRDGSIEVISITDVCIRLPPNGYVLECQEVIDRGGTPPAVEIQLKDGGTIEKECLYAQPR